MIKALAFLTDTFTRLYLLILLLRFWLPLLRANFRNPVAQGVLRYTSPLVTPVRRFVPAIGRIDTATVLIAFVLQYLALLALSALARIDPGALMFSPMPQAATPGLLALVSIVELASLSVTLFIVAIIIRVILNLMGRYFGPISDMLVDLTEPLLKPVRRIIPPMGVVDLSAFIGIILLIALNMVLSDLIPGMR